MHYPFTLTPLPYAYDALEPYIDEETMHLHHDKHLATYVENLNAALAPYPATHGLTLEELLFFPQRLPEKIRTTVQNNAGGVYNHDLYFSAMTPHSSGAPVGGLAAAIMRQFGSYEEFSRRLRQAGQTRFGSGWAWLATNSSGRLYILSTANQDVPFPLCPVLPLDVWEHAYYLKYQNRRADYLANWMNTIDWERANERYQRCLNRRRYPF